MNNTNSKIFYFYFLWHGLFLSLTMSMIDFNTVFPSLVDSLTEYKIIFGILYSIMLGAPLLFNAVFSHYMKKYKYKKKFLLIGIYLRALSFLGMALFVYFFSVDNSNIVIVSFFFLILMFSISGGFAGLSYSELIGKLFSSKERGTLYSSKQFVGSIAAFAGGMVVNKVFSLGSFNYPFNYVILLSIGFIGLVIASLGFWLIKEPPSIVVEKDDDTLINYLKEIPSLLKKDSNYSNFILVENMASFSLMILPFYMVFARDIFNIDQSYIGKYLLFQISGTVFSNFIWGYLSRKFGAKSVIKVCILTGGTIPLVALFLSRIGPDAYSFVFLLLGFIISGRRIGFDSYLLDIAPEDKRTVYLGVRGTLNILVVILPIMGSIFIEILGYAFTFILVSSVMFLGFYLFAFRSKANH